MYMYVFINLRIQFGCAPLHVPFSKQVLEVFPLLEKPLSQVYWAIPPTLYEPTMTLSPVTSCCFSVGFLHVISGNEEVFISVN